MITLEDIVDSNLCARCGACLGICPNDIISHNEDYFPEIKGTCPDGCKLCVEICPGLNVDFQALSKLVFGTKYNEDNPYGEVEKAFVGYSSDPFLRSKGSSGGLVTQTLLYLFDKGKIDGAVISSTDPSKPWKPLPMLVKDKDSIINGAQSKYGISPNAMLISDLETSKGPLAFVGLPCHVHALRKLSSLRPELYEKIGIILGLYCHMALENTLGIDLIRNAGLKPQDVVKIEFRSGEWPGKIRALLKNGQYVTLFDAPYKTAFNWASKLYYPIRCLYCIDGSNEFADISFADPWIGKDKSFLGGWTMAVARTKKGLQVLMDMEDSESSALKEIDDHTFKKSNATMIKMKRERGLYNISILQKKNKIFPSYNIIVKEFRQKRIPDFRFVLGRYPITRKIGLRIAQSPIRGIIEKVVKRLNGK